MCSCAPVCAVVRVYLRSAGIIDGTAPVGTVEFSKRFSQLIRLIAVALRQRSLILSDFSVDCFENKTTFRRSPLIPPMTGSRRELQFGRVSYASAIAINGIRAFGALLHSMQSSNGRGTEQTTDVKIVNVLRE